MTLHIGIDFDGVICNFHAGVCEVISRDFGVEVKETDITSWDMGAVLDPLIGRSWWSWMEDHAKLWGEKFKPVTGALGSIERLRQQGHTLEIVTSKPQWAEAAFWKWMGKYEPSVQRVTIVDNAESKADVTDADVLIDDHVVNVTEFARAGGIALLFERPHNKDIKVDGDLEIWRVDGWQQVMRSITMIGMEETWAATPDSSA